MVATVGVRRVGPHGRGPIIGSKFTPAQREHFKALLNRGYNITQASREVGCSRSTGNHWARDLARNGDEWRMRVEEQKLPEVVPFVELGPEAKRALFDFEFFRLRYFGRTSSPWQLDAAQNILTWAYSDDTEFVVQNAPPGGGKSTLWHDVVCWMIVRDRSVRILLGSRTQRQADKYAGRVKASLERTRPLGANPKLGRMVDAQACLAADYGRFKPRVGVWRREEFVVQQVDDEPGDEKEPTVAAYGQDSGSLGHRALVVLWDDLVDKTSIRTADAQEDQREWWDSEGENRTEPGGLCCLNGQRRGPEDLYRYNLDKRLGEDEVETDEELAALTDGKYRHIVYRAHYEELCTGDHSRDAVAYDPADPDAGGCLLDPKRLPWKGSGGLATRMRNSETRYRVEFQQEDTDPQSVLVQKVWVNGGRDADGIEYPGCWDNDRDLCELPRNLASPLVSAATVDPSSANFWALEWWVYSPATQYRYLMDLERRRMDAPDLLDWNELGGVHHGWMETWQTRSEHVAHALGLPVRINYWIIERNAAQRYLLAYEHVTRWKALRSVEIIPHDTGMNKLDPDLGVESVKNVYRYQQVRLPGARRARPQALKLVTEATHYPDVTTTDCLMAQWFFEFHLPTLRRRSTRPTPKPAWRPQFMLEGSAA